MGFLFLMLIAVICPVAAGEGPSLLKDIVPQSPVPLRGLPTDFSRLGNRSAFVANSLSHHREIWLSDGTAEGTSLLVDLCPGRCGLKVTSFLSSNGRIFFDPGMSVEGLSSGETSLGLWTTDGTLEGTFPLPQVCRSCFSLKGFFFGGSTVLVDRGSPGATVWITDGTPGGTQNLAELDTFGGGAFARLGDFLLVRAGGRLLRTDGSAAGTQEISEGISIASGIEILGSQAFFFSEAFEPSLWKTDGTSAGTILVGEFSSDQGAPNGPPRLHGPGRSSSHERRRIFGRR